MRRLTLLLSTFVLLYSSTCALAQATSKAGKFSVELKTEPSPPTSGENVFTMAIADGQKPLTGASVTVHVDMVGMSMPADFEASVGAEEGQYIASVTLGMKGKWKVDVGVAQMAGMAMSGDGTAHFVIETDKAISAKAEGGGFGRTFLIVMLVVVVLVGGAAAIRYRGRLPHGTRGVVGGVLAVAVVFVVTAMVVKKYRDPRTATVVGSAAMDMSAMQAPVGKVAVATETVGPRPFAAPLTYPGTVVADVEEHIYPRVTGRLVYMPHYPGDKISPGQVVARLDTTELAAKEAQAAHGTAEARQGVGAATADVSTARARRDEAATAIVEAQAKVAQARSALRSHGGAIKAAESDVEAAEQRVREAGSAVLSAQAGVEEAGERGVEAEGRVDSAQADVTYWDAEIAREKKLFRVGAVSEEELDRELAQAATAKAKLKQAKASVRAARAGVTRAEQRLAEAEAREAAGRAVVRAAEARLTQAEAERDAAGDKVAQAQAAVRVCEAAVRAADANVGSARAQVGVARASTKRAQAALTEARTVRGYTEIRAVNSGVVTARLISPGVLVRPGMPILTIAKVDPVRLQASISQEDLATVSVGQTVTVRTREQPDQPVDTEITAIFPASDPTARTSLVEARTPNPDGRLKLGQYLTFEIARGRPGMTAITVPNNVLISREGRTTLFVVATDGGRTVARRVVVEPGTMGNERTEILSGLKNGDDVIVVGQNNLRDGDPVSVVGRSGRTTRTEAQPKARQEKAQPKAGPEEPSSHSH